MQLREGDNIIRFNHRLGIRCRRVNFYWLEANDTSLTEENQVKEMIVQFMKNFMKSLKIRGLRW